jgi:hypothetical protein
MDSLEIVWHATNGRDSWAKKLKEELENIGSAHIWQSKFEKIKNEIWVV